MKQLMNFLFMLQWHLLCYKITKTAEVYLKKFKFNLMKNKFYPVGNLLINMKQMV